MVPFDNSVKTIDVTFPAGLPGFEDRRRFQLLAHADLAPLQLLQSKESAGLCFLAIPSTALEPDYELALTESDRATLNLDENANLLCLAILTVPQEGPVTANLLAPLVIDLAKNLGIQAVREDNKYSHQHPLPEALQCL